MNKVLLTVLLFVFKFGREEEVNEWPLITEYRIGPAVLTTGYGWCQLDIASWQNVLAVTMPTRYPRYVAPAPAEDDPGYEDEGEFLSPETLAYLRELAGK